MRRRVGMFRNSELRAGRGSWRRLRPRRGGFIRRRARRGRGGLGRRGGLLRGVSGWGIGP